jgi:hypothetical protein
LRPDYPSAERSREGMVTRMPATAKGFVNARNIRIESERANENPNIDDMPVGSNHYRVTLRYGRRQMTVPWSQGPAITHDPDAADVLDALASDATGFEQARDFEDWASEYGYDPDSRKAERTYKAIERQTRQLKQFLDDKSEDYETLLYGLERL